jgi:predicted acyltransferase
MTKNATRLVGFDYFRGFLLLSMVLAHTAINLGKTEPSPTLYQFVSTGFVLFVGLLLSLVLIERKQLSEIIWRGVKLLLVFLLFNLLLWLAGIYDWPPNFEFFLANTSAYSTLEILLPISLVVIIAPILRKFLTAPLLLAIGLSLLLIMDVTSLYPYSFKYLAIGLLGLAFGELIPRSYWDAKRLQPVFLPLALLLVLAISFVNYWLFNVLLVLTLYFILAPVFVKTQLNFLSLLGQNSLFLYVLHILLIRLIMITGWHFDWGLIIIAALMISLVCYFLLLFTLKMPPLRQVQRKIFN